MVSGKGAHAHDIAHHKSNRLFLRDLDYKSEPIYSLTVVKTIERRPAMRRRLGCSSTVMRAASGGAPTPGMALTAAVVVGAPLGDRLAQEAPAQWLDGDGLAWQWWLNFGVSRGHRDGVYIGERCGMIQRDNKVNFLLNLILSSMIIDRT
jgi:hypothetical protein